MTCRSWQSEDDLVIKEEQNEYSYELTGKKSFGKSSSGDPVGGSAIGVIQAAALILVGVGGVLAKVLAIVMTAAAGVLFFCTSFSGGNAVIVILTATALFWLPELAGVLLTGLVLLQRKIADTFLV